MIFKPKRESVQTSNSFSIQRTRNHGATIILTESRLIIKQA
jgi:hypothetical protein